MGWRDLLERSNQTVTLPWLGSRSLHSESRIWRIVGDKPEEFGWYTWEIEGRKARLVKEAGPDPNILRWSIRGYLVGDRIVSDDARVDPEPRTILRHSEKVYLIDPGMDRFARVRAGRVQEGGPLIFANYEFPIGPEDRVLEAFLDKKPSVTEIPEVTPALDAAFRMEVFQREEAERRRQELARRRREEEERRQREERRKQLIANLGDGEKRRLLALEDFEEAARAALAVGGAELLDHRPHRCKDEWVVRYRLDGQRFECVCDVSLQIVDSGICLVDHDTEEKGDTYFTLESLPGVVRQAIREGRLVVYRHV